MKDLIVGLLFVGSMSGYIYMLTKAFSGKKWSEHKWLRRKAMKGFITGTILLIITLILYYYW